MKSHHKHQHHLPYSGWPTGIPAPPSPSLHRWLTIRPTVQPFLMRRSSTSCRLCATSIDRGDTAWRPVVPLHIETCFCTRCGTILALHSGAWSWKELLRIPPIGGPPADLVGPARPLKPLTPPPDPPIDSPGTPLLEPTPLNA